jgi:hypothetical protein
MKRMRELLLKLPVPWVGVEELTKLPRGTRLVLLALMAWSGVAAAASLAGLVAIEVAGRSAAAGAATEPRAGKLERSGGEAILQRPIFSRTRQPALAVVALPQAPPPPPAALPPIAARDSAVRLKGVFMSSPFVKAFLISAQNPGGAWVKPEELFGGWKLVAVRPSEIELESGGERVTVLLGEGSPANEQTKIVQKFQPSPLFRR